MARREGTRLGKTSLLAHPEPLIRQSGDEPLQTHGKMRAVRDTQQTMQRIKVGVIGLVAVVLLIVVASAILGSATRERPIAAAGSAQADVVANIAMTNAGAAAAAAAGVSGEPLAELGVAPSTGNSQAAR